MLVVRSDPQGGDKLTLTVPDSDKCNAVQPTPAVDSVSPVDVEPSHDSDDQTVSASPVTPVTITHFQRAENGTLEKKTLRECVNPFMQSPSPCVSPRVRTTASTNPFVVDGTSGGSNPFLLRLASPIPTIRNAPSTAAVESLKPIGNEPVRKMHPRFLSEV